MLAIALIVVVVLMACNQTQTIGSVIHEDPQIPVAPPTGELGPPAPIDIVAEPPTPEPIGVQPFVDPAEPIQPSTDDAPPMYVSDPWTLDGQYSSSNPSQPVKTDPVAYIPPVYDDPAFPVPTDTEKQANASAGAGTAIEVVAAADTGLQAAIDPYLPVPTPASDPAQFSQPPDVSLSPDVNPIDNWTAETSSDTECPPSVEIDYQPETYA